MKFLHAADLHIDSPLHGLGDFADAPVSEIRLAPREAFRRLIRLAQTEQVDFVVLAGDIFDGSWNDMGTALFFSTEIKKLHPIPVFVMRGNHDAETELFRRLPPLEHVHEFNTTAPETKRLDAIGVAIHGQSYGSRAVTTDISARYPRPLRDYVNIGVLHTSLAGGYAGHDNYAPCSLAALKTHDYDYWALGHIHMRQELRLDPYVIFPGNLQGRHIKETGPKGCYIVEGEAGNLSATFHPLDVVRWMDETVDVTGLPDENDALSAAYRVIEACKEQQAGPLLCVRITLTGATDAHRELVRNAKGNEDALRARVGPDPWLTELRLETDPLVDVASVRRQDDLTGELFRALDQARVSPEQDEGIGAILKPLASKLPGRVQDLFGTRFDDPDVLRSLIDRAERILAAEIFGSK
jgi:exonuclease SbcD